MLQEDMQSDCKLIGVHALEILTHLGQYAVDIVEQTASWQR